ncbi:hypothetical protein JTE90_004301 [Oedothorax gibbosus]|uniref:Membralin n=1 Tax=Oedothorax gibbosus TaxID=931172 RepID=A0AAV6VK74_9ARAC|nr:hypothetical protein JTE90_004301 [Oedothorax gibbosus]
MPEHHPQQHPVQQLLVAMDILPLDGEGGHFSNNNNNNQNTLWQLRDRLFQVLFERATVAYAATFHERLRKVIEFGLLVLAVISLCTLIYVHATFVRVPVNCLEEETKTWSREGVLRIEISMDEQTTKAFNISKYYNSTLASHFSRIKQERKIYLEMMEKKRKALQKLKLEKPQMMGENIDLDLLDPEKSPVFINRTVPFKDSVSDPDCFSPLKATLSDTEMFTNTVWPQEKYIIEYSLEYGFLRLSPGARQNTSVKVHTVVLDPFKDQCFGNQFSRFLLKYVLGYNDLLMGSLRWLVDKDESKGFIRNVVTGDQYRFVDKSTTWTAYFSAAFFMVIFTLSVSMLLRYSHHQIFLFVVELLHIFEMNTVSFPAAPLLTVVLALVGMEAIMSEFFNDSVTAFYVIIIVWIADQFDSICCRTVVSKRHWLRLFYLYHFGFYAYHYRFDGQYSFLALLTSWLFIQHSMVYFFHRYELPSIWVANENDVEYDSDTSYQGDNYAMVDSLDDEGSEDTQEDSSDPGPDSGIEDNAVPSSATSSDSSSTSSDSSSTDSLDKLRGRATTEDGGGSGLVVS